MTAPFRITSYDGSRYADCPDMLYGDIPIEHDTIESARAALRTLETTGDWPAGRPTYTIERLESLSDGSEEYFPDSEWSSVTVEEIAGHEHDTGGEVQCLACHRELIRSDPDLECAGCEES
jgi:hypothetical protein